MVFEYCLIWASLRDRIWRKKDVKINILYRVFHDKCEKVNKNKDPVNVKPPIPNKNMSKKWAVSYIGKSDSVHIVTLFGLFSAIKRLFFSHLKSRSPGNLVKKINQYESCRVLYAPPFRLLLCSHQKFSESRPKSFFSPQEIQLKSSDKKIFA